MADIRHLDAFEFYYALGSARTHEQVAQKFNKSRRTVETWSYKEKWQEEIKRRNFDALEDSRRQSILSRRNKATQYQNIIKGSINTYIERLKQGKIEITDVKDLDRLIRLDLLLDGYVYAGETALLNEEKEKQKDNSDEKESISISFDIKGGVDGED